jgi:beta-galactosidase beta subunit
LFFLDCLEKTFEIACTKSLEEKRAELHADYTSHIILSSQQNVITAGDKRDNYGHYNIPGDYVVE